jgi:hypothetical protein
MVVIIIWLTVAKYQYLKWQWIFYFLRICFSVLYNCQYFDRTCLYIWVMRRVSCKKQEISAIHNHLGSPPVFSGARVTRSLVLSVTFVDRCLSFCTFGHCVVCPSSIYRLWLPLWYLQILLIQKVITFHEMFLSFKWVNDCCLAHLPWYVVRI